MKSIFHVGTLIGVLFAAQQFYSILVATDISAIQQADGVAIAVAWVVIPYCFARAMEQLLGG